MSLLDVLGTLALVCFFSRFFLQWLASEKSKKSAAPTPFFWSVSLVGSGAMMAYTLLESEYVLFAGAMINGLIYARNLALRGRDTHPLSNAWVGFVALVAAALLILSALAKDPAGGGSISGFWLACVVIGQALWTARFVIQWMASERAGSSHFPDAFWWTSLVGGSLLLAYTIQLGDLYLIAGYVMSPLVPLRNLMLRRKTAGQAPSRMPGAGSPG